MNLTEITAIWKYLHETSNAHKSGLQLRRFQSPQEAHDVNQVVVTMI